MTRERRREVARVLQSWAAYENDPKTMRKELGYKSPAGQDFKRNRGTNSVYDDYKPEYDSDFLEHVSKVIMNISDADDKKLIYHEYQDHPNLDWVDYRDSEKVKLAAEFKVRYYSEKPKRWSKSTGRSAGAYRMALSRLKDDLYWPIFKYL